MNRSKLASRFARDRRGVSAIEFAMIAPVLILMYVGLAEVGNALTIYRRTATVAMTAADLTAQTKTLKTADLKDIVGASSSILAPYAATSPTPLKIVISSVVADQNNSGKVAWSYASNGATARGVNSAYTVPNGLTEAGTSVIVSEITYAFTPLLDLPQIFSDRPLPRQCSDRSRGRRRRWRGRAPGQSQAPQEAGSPCRAARSE